MDQTLIVIVLMMTAAAGVFYVFVYPYLSRQVVIEQRTAQFKQTKVKRNERVVDQNKRRQQILDSVKDIEGNNKKRQNTLQARLLQAGLTIEPRQFLLISAGVGLALGFLSFLFSGNPFIALGAVVAGALGLPRWVISFLTKRRLKKFLAAFPGAVDIIIRGIKAGLPLGQCIAIIAAESPEPVRTEFRRILEAQTIGLSVAEAAERLPESMPLAEASFFSIVINLQQKSGGNLSEALGNLSRVLRDRSKMRLKVAAMSSEAKASAGIIAALPFGVGFMVYLSSPDYIKLLFTHTTGHIVMGVCAVWMAAGVFIMKKMISFDF